MAQVVSWPALSVYMLCTIRSVYLQGAILGAYTLAANTFGLQMLPFWRGSFVLDNVKRAIQRKRCLWNLMSNEAVVPLTLPLQWLTLAWYVGR